MTTTVIHSVGTSSREYSTINAWLASFPADFTLARTGQTTQAGSTSSTIVLDSSASSTDGFYVGHPVWKNAQTGDTHLITGYVGSTRTATIGPLNGGPATWQTGNPGVEAYTVDSILYRGECYNDSEFGPVAGVGIEFPSFTSSTTQYAHLTTATGQSFRDNAGVRTNPLIYDQTKGVGWAGNPTAGSNGNNILFYSNSTGEIHISKFQFRSTGTFYSGAVISMPTANAPEALLRSFRDCIIQNEGSSNGRSITLRGNTQWYNVVYIDKTSSGRGIGITTAYANNAFLENCTIVRSGSAASTGLTNASGSHVVKNTQVFGFSTCFSGSFGGTSDYNAATDATAPGAHSQQSLTYANEVISVTADYRLKTGATSIAHGNTDATNNPNDISGIVRGVGTNGSIGAWDVLSSFNATLGITQADTIVALTATYSAIALKVAEIVPGFANKTGVNIRVWKTATPATNRGAEQDHLYNQTIDSLGTITLATPNCLAAGATVGSTGWMEVENSSGSVSDTTGVAAGGPVTFKQGP